MEQDKGYAAARAKTSGRPAWKKQPGNAQCNDILAEYRRSLAGFTERFGPWQSVYSRFRAWTKAGVWEDVLTNLIQQDIVDETTLMLDSTTVKVHQHASGAKKGETTRPPDAAAED